MMARRSRDNVRSGGGVLKGGSGDDELRGEPE